MRVGILTFHNNENKGALLQAYCLQSVLSKLTRSRVDVIDYRPLAKEMGRYIACLNTQTIFRDISDLLLCRSFQKNYLNLGINKIITNNYDDSVSWLKSQEYDAIVVGSDEVWKIRQDKGFRSTLFSRPFPNLYFLNQKINCLKFSYAASFGKTDFESLTNSQINYIKMLISEFDCISVRDHNSENILSRMGIKDVFRVPDPTFLLDIPEMDAKQKLQKIGVDFSKPLSGIHGTRHPIFRKICNILRRKGYQVISLDYSPYADFNLRGNVSVFEYLSLYKYFDILITFSLHSTIFSIKHGTPFIAIDVAPVYKKIESKIHSLLEDFSMLDRYINANSIYGLEGNIERCLEPLNCEEIDDQIKSLKQKGLEYLSFALKKA